MVVCRATLSHPPIQLAIGAMTDPQLMGTATIANPPSGSRTSLPALSSCKLQPSSAAFRRNAAHPRTWLHRRLPGWARDGIWHKHRSPRQTLNTRQQESATERTPMKSDGSGYRLLLGALLAVGLTLAACSPAQDVDEYETEPAPPPVDTNRPPPPPPDTNTPAADLEAPSAVEVG